MSNILHQSNLLINKDFFLSHLWTSHIIDRLLLSKICHNGRMENKQMQHMINILKKKNFYLELFKSINSEELNRIQKGDLSNLESFYYDREILLNAMDKIDKQLSQYKLEQLDDVSENSKRKIISLLKNKKQFIYTILNQDVQIHDTLNASLSLHKEEKIA